MLELRSKCREHRPNRLSADGDLSVARPDEDNIRSAESDRSGEISPLERLIESG